ncbi:MAG: hypothetical protein ACREIT_03430, partial [Tepidisphaeraceae bacterium]
LQGFTALTDTAIFLFGLAMVFEAVALIAASRPTRARRALLALALLVTLVATAFNLFVTVRLFGAGITPWISLLAVAFGGYIAMYEWRLLQRTTVT